MRRRGEPDLARRFRDRLETIGAPRRGERVVVAVSGGLDSLVLLHLFRFTRDLPDTGLVGAHLDHRMRPGARADALWLRGVLRAWRVEGRFGVADEVPRDEAGARRIRYAFLRGAREEEGAAWIATAHHADDQAETVLFRVLRGTGSRGLGGIPERRKPGILRPLLPFRRRELRGYAEEVGLTPRRDPMNTDPRFARTVLRHEILPRVEETFAPGARRALLRLSRLARREDAAWRSLELRLLDGVLVGEEREEGERLFLLDRSGLVAYHPGVRARLLRRLLRRLGVEVSEAGTRAAVEFTSSGASGRAVELPDGVVLSREFDRLVLGRVREATPGRALRVEAAGSGSGAFAVGGRRMVARWSLTSEPTGTWIERFSPSKLHFPLCLRSREAGDRIRLAYGSKKVKKLFAEGGIPLRRRDRWPVLDDARGRVLWVPGIARSHRVGPERHEAPFTIGIADADNVRKN